MSARKPMLLRPLPWRRVPTTPVEATSRVTSKPACDIYIDGKPTGSQTPQPELKLTAGKHLVSLRNTEHAIEDLCGPGTDGLGFFTSAIRKLAGA